MMKKTMAFAAGLMVSALTLTIYTGCSLDSANSVSRTVGGVDVSGVYRNSDPSQNNGLFVSLNSGRAVRQMDLRQTGDQLEAIDNNGIIFRGTIGNVNESENSKAASFSLEGSTTAGNGVLLSGSITVQDGGVMRGTWIEDGFFATVYGIADGPTSTSSPGGGGGSLSITPSGAQTIPIGTSRSFSVSSPNGSVTWSVTGNIGSVSPANGNSTTFTAGNAGTGTIKAEDSTGSGTVSITVN